MIHQRANRGLERRRIVEESNRSDAARARAQGFLCVVERDAAECDEGKGRERARRFAQLVWADGRAVLLFRWRLKNRTEDREVCAAVTSRARLCECVR